MSGRFIALEGGDASGKSTQAALLAEHLGAVLTREPGGTALGERLRAVLLNPASGHVDGRAEALLMVAARAQHVREVIEPALASGRDVVTDRFSGSTLAYQGWGRGIDIEELRHLCDWAAAGRWPDLNVLVDVPPAVARARRAGQGDRLEEAGDDFHLRVGAGFKQLAAADGDRWAVVDGTGPIEAVAADVRRVVAERLAVR